MTCDNYPYPYPKPYPKPHPKPKPKPHPEPDPKPDPKPKEKECNCCIEIKDSIVVIICGEVDFDRLKDSLDTFVGEKGKENTHYNHGNIIYPRK